MNDGMRISVSGEIDLNTDRETSPGCFGNRVTACSNNRRLKEDRMEKPVRTTARRQLLRSVDGMPKVLLLVILIAGSFVLAAPARAAESVQVKMTFTETHKNCALEDGVCGHGEVIPLGHATETIQFWGACGGNCDLRTISLDGGTIVAEETPSGFQCPGSCNAHHGFPGSATLDDVIVGGTGVYEGATGTLTGTVRFAGEKGTVELSGTMSFGS